MKMDEAPQHIEECESCSQLLSSLSEYIDGALSPELCAAIEEHMKDCQRCTIVVNTLKKTVELYHENAEGTELPDDVKQRLYVRLNIEDFMHQGGSISKEDL